MQVHSQASITFAKEQKKIHSQLETNITFHSRQTIAKGYL